MVIGIIGAFGDDKTTTPATSTTPTPEVVVTHTPDPTVAPTAEPVATATMEPSMSPTDVPTPVATPMSASAIETTTDPTAYVLKQGDKNADVKALQKVLISLGWLSGSADGDFGPKTVSAVKAYQDAAGLPVTGECDYDTYLSLTSANAPTALVQIEEDESVEVAYIGNRSTKKFHYPGCSSVDDMKESNKVELYSRDEATAAGYVPCKRCNP